MARPTCAIDDTSGCLNNTATSTFTTTTSPADADGSGNSLNATDLTGTAGWQSGKTVTIDGATITLPEFGTGAYDNMLASGQTVTLPDSGVVNTGAAVVFLAFATGAQSRTPPAPSPTPRTTAWTPTASPATRAMT